jgi:hypothetical protein
VPPVIVSDGDPVGVALRDAVAAGHAVDGPHAGGAGARP